MQMDQIFRPLTSSPFRRDDTYTEILPCEALRPYICCFWGTSQPLQTCDAACESLVTPDTCMDILIDLDYTRQSLSSRFVAIDDRAFGPRQRHRPSCRNICRSVLRLGGSLVFR